jgi:hypothetical protein
MAYKINLPKNPKLQDFHTAKCDLHVQHLTKVASAPDRDQWAFGQCVAQSAQKLTRAFKKVLRTLNETCLSLTGEACVSESDLDD